MAATDGHLRPGRDRSSQVSPRLIRSDLVRSSALHLRLKIVPLIKNADEDDKDDEGDEDGDDVDDDHVGQSPSNIP